MLRNTLTFFITVVIFALQIVLFFLAIYFWVSAYSSGTLVKDTVTGAPYKTYSLPWFGWIGLIFLMVSTAWIFLFINNLGDYMVSAATCEDYFQTTSSCSKGVFNTLIYHLGSVALASAVLFPSAIVQAIYSPIYDLITRSGDEKGAANWLQKCASVVCLPIKWPYKKFVMRTGEQGFPLGYLACCNFCPASKEAFYLIESYTDILGSIILINFIYRLSGALAIASLNTFIASIVFTSLDYYTQRLTNPLIPTIVGFSDLDRLFAVSSGGNPVHEHPRHRH